MSSKKIKLYYHPISQPSRSVYMFMKKHGIDAEFIVVDILTGEHKNEEMLKKNSFGAVPFIEYKKKSGGKDLEVLTESSAILTHLIAANKKLKDHWYPNDKDARSKVDQYLGYHSTGIRQALVRAFLYETFMKQQMGQQYGEKKILEDMYMEVERLGTMFLKGNNFLTGKEISIADLLAFNEVAQMSLTKYGDNIIDKYPDVKAWYGRVKEYFKDEYNEIYGALNKLAAAFPKPSPTVPTLYYHPISQPSRTLVMFMKKMEIDCEFQVVNILTGEHKTEEMKKLNPMQAVPFLNYKSDSGENDVYTESTAIMGLLCDSNNGVKVDDHWFPKDEKKHAKIAAYLSYHSTGIRQALVRVFLHSTFLTEQMEQQYGLEKMLKDMEMELNRLENDFIGKDRKFIYSDEISIADIFAANEIGQLSITSYWDDLFKNHPGLGAWYKRVQDAMNPHFDELYKDLRSVMGKPAEEDTAL